MHNQLEQPTKNAMSFNQKGKLTKYDNNKICQAILTMTSNRGHTQFDIKTEPQKIDIAHQEFITQISTEIQKIEDRIPNEKYLGSCNDLRKKFGCISKEIFQSTHIEGSDILMLLTEKMLTEFEKISLSLPSMAHDIACEFQKDLNKIGYKIIKEQDKIEKIKNKLTQYLSALENIPHSSQAVQTEIEWAKINIASLQNKSTQHERWNAQIRDIRTTEKEAILKKLTATFNQSKTKMLSILTTQSCSNQLLTTIGFYTQARENISQNQPVTTKIPVSFTSR